MRLGMLPSPHFPRRTRLSQSNIAQGFSTPMSRHSSIRHGRANPLVIPYIVPSLSLTELYNRMYSQQLKSHSNFKWRGEQPYRDPLPRFVNPPPETTTLQLSFEDAVAKIKEELHLSRRMVDFAMRCGSTELRNSRPQVA